MPQYIEGGGGVGGEANGLVVGLENGADVEVTGKVSPIGVATEQGVGALDE